MVVLNPWISGSAKPAQGPMSSVYYPPASHAASVLVEACFRKFRRPEAIRSLWSNLRQSRSESAGETAEFMVRMRTGLTNFDGRTLLVLSGNDLVAKELLELAAMDAEWRRGSVAEPTCPPDRDPRCRSHRSSRRPWAQAVERHTLAWLGSW